MPYVRTVDNFADFFTKPIVGHNFFRMRDTIMNCDSRASKQAGRAVIMRSASECLPCVRRRMVIKCHVGGPGLSLQRAARHILRTTHVGARRRLRGMSLSEASVIGKTPVRWVVSVIMDMPCSHALRPLGILLRRMGGR